MWGAGFLVAVLCLLAAAPVKSETAQGLSLVYKGRGAFNSRDFARSGHCGLGLSKSLDLPWRSGVRSVAINSIQYGSSSICGLCIAYRGLKPGGPFKRDWQYGIVVDDCTKCKFGDIVVYNKGSGYHNIEWVAVQCKTGNTPFQYTFQGGNNYYFKIAISNTRVPVKAVQLKLGPKKYAKLNRMKDNFWEYNPFGRKIKFPVTLKITSYIGDSVEETIPSKKPVGTVRGTKQFPLKRQFSAVP